MRDKTVKEAFSIDAAISNSHKSYSTITERLWKSTDLKKS
jgi:hypothetical protein